MKVLVGGKFNVIHPGHVFFLRKARSRGDTLTVVLAHDRTPGIVVPARERKKVLASLRCVDKVVIGYPITGEAGYLRVIRDERPGIIALGYDQHVDIHALEERIKKLGLRVRIVRIPELKGYATRTLIKK
ncbi:MAG: adenylyltransferase/cytidyltransferase family protein [Candidatus Aenigmarchaeota archaeon]|nr:adenylyltransferase/cytidyltransferase family protein [Candidatus Aenigmarchaeota archaeon]